MPRWLARGREAAEHVPGSPRYGALAEFERDLIRDRTQAGLTAARARGRLGGRPKAHALDTPRKVQMAQALYNDKSNSVADICRTLRISRATLYRYVKTRPEAEG